MCVLQFSYWAVEWISDERLSQVSPGFRRLSSPILVCLFLLRLETGLEHDSWRTPHHRTLQASAP